MSEIVPAISMWQPWASLLFTPAKLDETRHWKAPSAVIGKRIAIHATKRPPMAIEVAQLQAVCNKYLPSDWLKYGPYGAIIGTAVLAACRPIVRGDSQDYETRENAVCGNWQPGRYAWRFTEHRLFAQAVPFNGRQGFFAFDLELAEAQ